MDGYDSFVNDDEEVIVKVGPNKEEYKVPPDSPEIDEIIDDSDEEREASSYDQHIGAEVVLTDRRNEKQMASGHHW